MRDRTDREMERETKGEREGEGGADGEGSERNMREAAEGQEGAREKRETLWSHLVRISDNIQNIPHAEPAPCAVLEERHGFHIQEGCHPE